MKPSREIRDLLIGFFHDFARSDPALVDMISPSDEMVLIGTDPEEFVIGGRQIRALLTRQLEEIGPIRVDLDMISAFEEGSVGWASFKLPAVREGGSPFDARGSFVCHREDRDWKIVQFHLSIGRTNREVLGLDLTTSIDEVADIIEQERPDLAPVASSEGTLTIMFTDLESSTATNEAMGDDVYRPLLLKHNEIVRSRTERAGGTVVKSQGDGFMLAFSSARRGVECAVAIQRDVSELDERFKVRVGAHTGEPVRHADDFYGRDVAYAARIGSAASGGEILVSSLVRSLVEPSGSVLFDGPRPFELKGFDGLQDVHVVKWD